MGGGGRGEVILAIQYFFIVTTELPTGQKKIIMCKEFCLTVLNFECSVREKGVR